MLEAEIKGKIKDKIKDILCEVIKENTYLYNYKGATIIDLPFLDKRQEPLSIKIYSKNNEILVTDEGFVFGRLYEEGLDPYRKGFSIVKKEIDFIKNQFDMGGRIDIFENKRHNYTEILFKTNSNDLKLFKKLLFNYINLLNNIYHLYYLSADYMKSSFKSIIQNTFKSNKINYKKDYKVAIGKIQLTLDFYLPKRDAYIETLGNSEKFYRAYYIYENLAKDLKYKDKKKYIIVDEKVDLEPYTDSVEKLISAIFYYPQDKNKIIKAFI